MNRNLKTVVVVAAILLLVMSLWLFRKAGTREKAGIEGTEVSSGTAVSPVPEIASIPAVSTATASPLAPVIKKSSTVKKQTSDPKPPEVKLHPELIPKNIEIIRCYYDQEISPPGAVLGFDINGSGFTSEFEKMIKVDAGSGQIKVKNFKLVTANQIHGQFEIGTNAKTEFIYPKVVIKGLPVFQSKDPFAVIRKGEVLNVIFIQMESMGRAGRFRIFTNLDQDLYSKFEILPSTAGLTISDIVPALPYVVEGTLRIAPGVPTGEYGLKINLKGKTLFDRPGMIRIVRPNVGQSGFVQGVTSSELYRRPGDTIDLYLMGSGFQEPDIKELNASIDEFNMGKATFTYINGTQLRLSFLAPTDVPAGSYGVTVTGANNAVLFKKSDVARIVPANWIGGVRVEPPARPGQTSTLRLLGRDFSDDFTGKLTIDLDEAGLKLGTLRRQDANTLAADITVEATVRPGDYWLQLKADGKKIDPPYGSIIKVQTATP